jgi:hypothetical protein
MTDRASIDDFVSLDAGEAHVGVRTEHCKTTKRSMKKESQPPTRRLALFWAGFPHWTTQVAPLTRL